MVRQDAIGGPVVYLAPRKWLGALGSLALRGALPLTFGYIGGHAEDCNSGGDAYFCGSAGAILGGLAGIGTAIALDAALLAREQAPAPPGHEPAIGLFGDGRRTLLTAAGQF